MNIAPASSPLPSPNLPAPGPVEPLGGDVEIAGKKRGARKTKDEFQPSAVHRHVADGLRAIGAGIAEQTEQSAAVADEAYIYPIESLYAAGKVYKHATKDVPVLKKTGALWTIAGFVGAYQNLMASMLLRAPGEMAHDLTHKVADAIDGKKTYDSRAGLT